MLELVGSSLMRQFTDAEIKQLEAKIKDEHERQIQLAKELVRNQEGSKKKSTSVKYVYLGFVLCLLAFNAFILFDRRNFGFDQFGGLMFVVWALFDCIAVYFTKTGWQRRVMKTVAQIWFVFMLAYGLWVLAELSIPLMAVWVVMIIFMGVCRVSIWRPIFGKNCRYN